MNQNFLHTDSDDDLDYSPLYFEFMRQISLPNFYEPENEKSDNKNDDFLQTPNESQVKPIIDNKEQKNDEIKNEFSVQSNSSLLDTNFLKQNKIQCYQTQNQEDLLIPESFFIISDVYYDTFKRYKNEIILRLYRLPNFESNYIVHLKGRWCNLELKANDPILVIGSFEIKNSQSQDLFNYEATIDNKNGFIVLWPYFMVSATRLSDSIHCLRRSILISKVPWDTTQSDWVLSEGTISHSLVESVLTRKIENPEQVQKNVNDLVNRNIIENGLQGMTKNQMTSNLQPVTNLANQLSTNLQNQDAAKKLDENITLLFQQQKEAQLQLEIEKQKILSENEVQKKMEIQTIIEQKEIENLRIKQEIKKYEIEKKKLEILNNQNINYPPYGCKVAATEENLISLQFGYIGICDVILFDPKKQIFLPLEMKSGNLAHGQIWQSHQTQLSTYILMMKEYLNEKNFSDLGRIFYMKDQVSVTIQQKLSDYQSLQILRNNLIYKSLNNIVPPKIENNQHCSKCQAYAVCEFMNDIEDIELGQYKPRPTKKKTKRCHKQKQRDEIYQQQQMLFDIYRNQRNEMYDQQQKDEINDQPIEIYKQQKDDIYQQPIEINEQQKDEFYKQQPFEIYKKQPVEIFKQQKDEINDQPVEIYKQQPIEINEQQSDEIYQQRPFETYKKQQKRDGINNSAEQFQLYLQQMLDRTEETQTNKKTDPDDDSDIPDYMLFSDDYDSDDFDYFEDESNSIYLPEYSASQINFYKKINDEILNDIYESGYTQYFNWTKTVEEREKEGIAVNGLTLFYSTEMKSFLFINDKIKNSKFRNYSKFVVTKNGKSPILSTGVVCKAMKNINALFVSLDKVLVDGETDLCIDLIKYVTDNTPQVHNLTRLFAYSQPSLKRVTSMLIDHTKSDFFKKKKEILFEYLNDDQRKAMKNSILSKDYTIISGCKSSGKTFLISSLIQYLSTMPVSVLIIGPSEKAVNFLCSLQKGIVSIYHVKNQDVIANKIESIQFGYFCATCVANFDDIFFFKKNFDILIVDDCEKIKVADLIGPMNACAKYVLCGDIYQARNDVKSIFSFIDVEKNQVNFLRTKYSKSEKIHILENSLIYNYSTKLNINNLPILKPNLGKLNEFHQIHQNWLIPILSSSTFFINTDIGDHYNECCVDSAASAAIAISLIACGMKKESIGIFCYDKKCIFFVKKSLEVLLDSSQELDDVESFEVHHCLDFRDEINKNNDYGRVLIVCLGEIGSLSSYEVSLSILEAKERVYFVGKEKIMKINPFFNKLLRKIDGNIKLSEDVFRSNEVPFQRISELI